MNDQISSVPLPASTASEVSRLKKLKGDNIYHARAIERWGAAVSLAATGGTWRDFYESRLSLPPPAPSPYALRQEVYGGDGWRLLIACVLMTR